MTRSMIIALEYLRRAAEHPDTDTGLTASETFYDREVDVAYIHHRTASGLVRAGYVRYGPWDPEGQVLELIANR